MEQLQIAIANRANSPLWKNIKVSWPDLVDKLSKTHYTPETYAEYMAMPKADQDRIKDVGGYVGGYLTNGRRRNKNLINRTVVTLDLDFAPTNFVDAFELIHGFESVIHSTHKHSSAKPRLRLIAPLSRECTPDEYEAVARSIGARCGISYFDPTTFQPARLMFWPSTSKGGDWVFKHTQGDVIDVDAVLAEYVNWRDISEWAYPDGDSPVPNWIDVIRTKQENPTEKKGIVGIFCRTFDIEQVIEEFLSDKYVPTGTAGRYSYTQGSTTGGLVIYDNLWAYSHHGSDPCSGKLCNAFDLVRLHKFGYMDEGSTLQGSKAPSYTEMKQWALKLPEVRSQSVEEMIAEHQFVPVPEDAKPWIEQLELGLDGKPLSTINNMRLVIHNDENLKGRLGYNIFDYKYYLMDDLGADHTVIAPEPMRNSDNSYVRSYLEHVYGMTGPAKIKDAMLLEFWQNRFHPVRDYLNSLEWDGTPRLATILPDVFGADDNVYSREVLARWMVAAVKRVFEPGCKFDEVLVIVGPQGSGKSTFLRTLGRSWFSDSFNTVETKEAFEQLHGAWIMEIAELSGFGKSEIEKVKHYLSKQIDTYRAAYAEIIEDYPRQNVFGATTNQWTFLLDNQNRRYWPIVNRPERAKYSVWDKQFTESVNQLWAEALQLYRDGYEIILSTEAQAVAAQMQESHRFMDDRQGIVEAFLSRKLPEDWNTYTIDERRVWLANLSNEGQVSRTRVTVAEIWCECFGKAKEEATRYNTREVADILRNLPNWTPSDKTAYVGPYGKQRYYEYEL